MKKNIALAGFALFSSLFVACGGSGGGSTNNTAPPPPPPSPPTVAVVNISTSATSSTMVFLGETIQYSASAEDSSGQVISGKTFSWTSSDDSVATVSSAGLVTAVGNGFTDISASTDGISSATDRITVSQLVTSIDVSPGTDALLTVDNSNLQLTATAFDSGGSPVVGALLDWNSSGSAVSVDSTGLVEAEQNGKTIVTAESGSIESNGVAVEVVVQKRLYIPTRNAPGSGDGNLVIVDSASATIVETISVTALPWYVATSDDGLRVFVVGNSTQSPLDVVAASTNERITSVPIADGVPGAVWGVAFSGSRNRLYIYRARDVGSERAGEIIIVDASSYSVVDRIPTGPTQCCFRAQSIVLSTDEQTLYVLSDYDHAVITIDTATDTIIERYEIGSGDNIELAQVPDGSRVFATSYVDPNGPVWPGRLNVIDPSVSPTKDTFDLDNNQVPPGWQVAANDPQWNPGSISNGRMEAVATDQQLRLEYDLTGAHSSIVIRARGQIQNTVFGSIHLISLITSSGEAISFVHQNEEFDASDGVNENLLRLNVAGMTVDSTLVPEKFPTFEYRVEMFGNYVGARIVDTDTGDEELLVDGAAPYSAEDIVRIAVRVAHTTDPGTTWLDDIQVSFSDVAAAPSVGFGPHSIAVTPGSDRAYIAGGGTDRLMAIDVASGSSLGSVDVLSQCCKGGQSLASADGSRIYVVNSNSGAILAPEISFVDIASSSVVDVATLSSIDSFHGGILAESASENALYWVNVRPPEFRLYVVSTTQAVETQAIDLPGVSASGSIVISPFDPLP